MYAARAALHLAGQRDRGPLRFQPKPFRNTHHADALYVRVQDLKYNLQMYLGLLEVSCYDDVTAENAKVGYFCKFCSTLEVRTRHTGNRPMCLKGCLHVVEKVYECIRSTPGGIGSVGRHVRNVLGPVWLLARYLHMQ
jgi:hypothetical protein